MAKDKSLLQLWEEQQLKCDRYQQPKWLWLWAALLSALLTTACGFTLGGWTTQGSAERQAAQAALAAKVELVANACAVSFASGSDYPARIATLRQASALKRVSLLQDEGWVTLAGMEEPLAAAAGLCAEKLADPPPAGANAMTTVERSKG